MPSVDCVLYVGEPALDPNVGEPAVVLVDEVLPDADVAVCACAHMAKAKKAASRICHFMIEPPALKFKALVLILPGKSAAFLERLKDQARCLLKILLRKTLTLRR